MIEADISYISSCSSKFKKAVDDMNEAIEQHCLEENEGKELTSAGIDKVRKEIEIEQKKAEKKEFLAKRGSGQAG